MFGFEKSEIELMGRINEFFCVVKKDDLGNDTVLANAPNCWATYRWTDEFGNSIAPFFTSQECGDSFLQESKEWRLRRFPITFVVEVILADIKNETSFYTIDPININRFMAQSPVQFLTQLIYREHPVGIQTQALVEDHQDIVPIKEFFQFSGDTDVEKSYTRLLADADLIFGIDEISGKQSIVFGIASLEELIRIGHCNILGIVNVGLGQEQMDIERLATLVKDIKGHHDYCGSGAI